MKKIVIIHLFLLPICLLIAQEKDTITDIRDGQTYNILKIGNQIWMAENLVSTHYSDGTPISGVYAYDDDDENVDTYGRLYTWDAVMNGARSSNTNPSRVQGVCPTGWHVPSDTEWTELIDYLGGTSVAGGKMKETGTTYWMSPNTDATNESGFTALPGGHIYRYICDRRFLKDDQLGWPYFSYIFNSDSYIT